MAELLFEKGMWVEIRLNADMTASFIGQIASGVSAVRGFKLHLHRLTLPGHERPKDAPSCANPSKAVVFPPGSVAFMRLLDGQPDWCKCDDESLL